MARPLEFNREHALISAMKLFWSQGYGATSLSQLIDVMGISKSSFYAAFNDKHDLFAETLVIFGDHTRDILLARRDESSALETIKAFFEQTIFEVPQNRMRCGCMMVNSVLELSDVEDDLSDLATQKLSEIEAEFEAIIKKGLLSGDLRSKQSAKNIAKFIMTINQGLRVASRKNLSKKELRAIVDTAMDTLDIALG